MTIRQEREERIRPLQGQWRQVLLREPVIAIYKAREVSRTEVVAGNQQDPFRITRFDRSQRVLQEVDPGGAAIGVLHQPAYAHPEPPGQVDRVVGTKGERCDAEAINVVADKPPRQPALEPPRPPCDGFRRTSGSGRRT